VLQLYGRGALSQWRLRERHNMALSKFTCSLRQARRLDIRTAVPAIVALPRGLAGGMCNGARLSETCGTVRVRLPNRLEACAGYGADVCWMGAQLPVFLCLPG